MKKFFLALVLLFSINKGFSQARAGATMVPIVNDVKVLIDSIEASGQEIVRIECDILKDTKESQRYFFTGYTYQAFVYSDDRLDKVDVELYKQDEGIWKLVDYKYSAPGYARLTVKPATSGMYKVVIKAVKFVGDNTACHYALLLYHE